MRNSRVTVLEIGAAHVAAGVFARGGNGGLALRRFAENRHTAEPALEAGWMERTALALKSVAQQLGSRGAVRLVVPGHLVLAKQVRVPVIAVAKRAPVIQFEAAQAIPWPLEDVVWEHDVVREDAREMEIRFTAIKLDPLHRLCVAAAEAGFRVSGVMAPGEALRRAFRFNHPEIRETVVIADIGARSTTLVIGGLDRYQARVIGSAGNEVTTAVGEELLLSFAEAEALKRKEAAEGFAPTEGYFPLTTKTGRKIVSQWQREITRFAASYATQTGESVSGLLYLTGGGSLLAGLPELLAEKHNPRVERFDSLRRVDLAGDLKTAEDGLRPAMANLVGLASATMDDAHAGWDLLPPALRSEQEFRRRQPYVVASAACLALALLPPLWSFHRLDREAELRLADTESRLRPQQQVAANISAALVEVGKMQTAIAQTQRLVETKSSWATFFADLQDRLATIEDVWLDRLALVPETRVDRSGKNPSPPASELRLMLGGRLLDPENPISKVSPESYQRVKRLLASFAGSPFVTAVRDEHFDNAQPGILRFDVTLVINPEHPL